MQQKPMPILEVRVNATGAEDACRTCGLRKERVLGSTETYVAGTERWVCADCALGIDAELASFAYDPGSRPARKQRFKGDIFDAHFGICPECGGCDGRKNIGSSHWCYCARHGLKWHAGTNWFSDWRDESMEDWWQNFLFLKRFRLGEPTYPEPSWSERFVQWLREWRHRFGPRPAAPVVDEEFPF